MTFFNKWVAKHKRLAWILFSLLEGIVCVGVLKRFGCPFWGLYLLVIFLVCFNFLFVHSAKGRLLKKPLLELTKNGDPKPLLDATQELLSFPNNALERQLFLIDHCVALREMGELQKVCDILSEIDIEQMPAVLTPVKVIYYNNLSDIWDLLGDSVRAETQHLRMLQIYEEMPENKKKRDLKHTVLLSSAESCFRNGEDSRALLLLEQIEKPEPLSKKVAVILLRAKLLVRANMLDEAKQGLREVIEIGNRLYAVQIAKRMLEDLDSTARA